jgi:hypothetical protein
VQHGFLQFQSNDSAPMGVMVPQATHRHQCSAVPVPVSQERAKKKAGQAYHRVLGCLHPSALSLPRAKGLCDNEAL